MIYFCIDKKLRDLRERAMKQRVEANSDALRRRAGARARANPSSLQASLARGRSERIFAEPSQ